MKNRKSGILMPIFSLPSSYGIGNLGKAAYEFADFLKATSQSYWQILPIGPTGYGDSPYQSFSSFAGNPYFIDPDELLEEGLLIKEELDGELWCEDERTILYDRMYFKRTALLEKAYKRFLEKKEFKEYNKFIEENSGWLVDYTSFMSKKEKRDEAFYGFLQFEFYKQWFKLKNYVNSLGIKIIGDIPIYVAMDSADVQGNEELFLLDSRLKPISVAGCPPDSFSATGQLWGNPLYDWDYNKETDYKWWIDRIKHSLKIYDILRIDHFRGFDEYYSIPASSTDAINGKWEKGPGIDLFKSIEKEVPLKGRIIAEDLGFLTDSVKELLNECGFPGMKIMQFAFDSRESGNYMPETWTENTVAYTGTHDNPCLKDWFKDISVEDRKLAADYLGVDDLELINSDYTLKFIKLTMNSASNTVIIPMQDWCRMGNEARVNTPSTTGSNWQFRFLKEDFKEKVAEEINNITKESGRI